ncbi:MAG: peptide chain release factor N(5)-glutamine methyltransferase [Chloroflexi bacterium]|nr:peptide chain release factor N(5)-glutamine methyltransferase [Chloroflexota bacterium]
MTLQEALLEARAALESSHVADAYAEAEVLLTHCLVISRAELYACLDTELTREQLRSYRRLIERRSAGEPSAYITGRREFFGLDFYVDRRVLIPRPETELLVEKALELAGGLAKSRHISQRPFDCPFASLRASAGDMASNVILSVVEESFACVSSEAPAGAGYGDRPFLIVDIGTGSGAIAVSLASRLPRAGIYATDISPSALEVARLNCEKHRVFGQVSLLRGDLLEPLPEPVDIIVANLPYIPSAVFQSLDREVKDHEPKLALHGGAAGLDLILRILEQAPPKLRPGGSLLLEVAEGQAGKVLAAADCFFPTARKKVFRDLAGIDRAVLVQTLPL